MAIRVATTTGETRAISIREAISTSETRAISIREAISASETREILGQGMVAPATFFDTLITRADVLTASEFMTQPVATAIRYRQNMGTNTGTLINEYVASGAPAGTPLLRGLATGSDTHTELRCFNDDLTSRGGVNFSGFPGWGQWPPVNSVALNDGLYIIDLTESVWYALSPSLNNSRSGGGSWINWSDGMRAESWASSFNNDGTANTYMSALGAATTARHMVMAVLDNHTYVPTF